MLLAVAFVELQDRDKSAEGEHFTSRRAVAESEEVAMLDDDDDAEELERQFEFVSWEVKLHPERWIGREVALEPCPRLLERSINVPVKFDLWKRQVCWICMNLT